MSIESQLGTLVGRLPDGVSEGVALGAGLADGYDLYESVIGDVASVFQPPAREVEPEVVGKHVPKIMHPVHRVPDEGRTARRAILVEATLGSTRAHDD